VCIRRSFRSTKLRLSGKFRYEHVYGHMDDYLWYGVVAIWLPAMVEGF
jgi:hypothetical protein